MEKDEMYCPGCGIRNSDDWPLEIDGVIKDCGCQDCWEKESDKKWWEMCFSYREKNKG